MSIRDLININAAILNKKTTVKFDSSLHNPERTFQETFRINSLLNLLYVPMPNI